MLHLCYTTVRFQGLGLRSTGFIPRVTSDLSPFPIAVRKYPDKWNLTEKGFILIKIPYYNPLRQEKKVVGA